VIIQAKTARSRTGRGDLVRPVAKAIIQGGMTLRLMGPHSRLKERHEGKRGGEARGPRMKRGEGPHSWSAQPVFNTSCVGVCVWVKACIMNNTGCFS
jgi:hypothetical protein